MTSTQIKYVLSKAGYTDAEIALDMDLVKFPIIFLDQSGNLYTDYKRTRYHFDFENEVLEVYSGHVKNGTFVYDYTNRPNHMIAFKLIAGFITSSKVTDVGMVEYRFGERTIDPSRLDFFEDDRIKSFNVKYFSEDNFTGLLQETTVETGSKAPFTGTAPTKEPTPQYIYTHTGWIEDDEDEHGLSTGRIFRNAKFKPKFTAELRTYTVNFINYDSTILETKQLTYGQVPTYTGNTPTRPDTDYSYFNFTGWRPSLESYETIYTGELPAVTANVNYYAVIDEYERMDWIQPNKFNISTVNIGELSGNIAIEMDGTFGTNGSNSVTDVISVGNGRLCSFGLWGDSLSRRINGDYQYLENCSGYDPETRHTWKLERNANNVKYSIDGNLCEQINAVVAGDTLACYVGGQVRASDAKIYFAKAYSNNKLARNLVPVQCVRTELYGMFDIITANHKPYMESGSRFTGSRFKVDFLNYDGTILQTTLYRYKSNVSYSGTTPTKPSSETYTYTFYGWKDINDTIHKASKALPTATYANTYTAVYSKSPLPEGYVEIQAITSTGTQYINTDYKPNQNTGIDVQWYWDPTLTTRSRAVFGVDESWFKESFSQYCDRLFVFGNTLYGWKNGEFITTTTDNNVYYKWPEGYFSILVDSNNKTFTAAKYTDSTFSTVQENIKSFNLNEATPATWSSKYNLYLFAHNRKGAVEPSDSVTVSIIIFKCKIYESGTLIRDFVPAIRKSDNKAGLYDKLNNKFYANAAGGEDFIPGEHYLDI